MPIKINERTVWESLWGLDSYGLLFVLLIIDYVLLSLVDSGRWGGLIRGVAIAVTVLFAVRTSDAHRSVLRLAQAAVVLALGAGVVQAVASGRREGGVAFLVLTLLLMITPVVVLRRVMPKPTVDIETLFAAIDVYIMIGLIFAMLYIGISHVATAPFFAQSGYHAPSDYVYFSFITLTTVGFGDLTPYTDVARSVVVMEALLGQIFLVTLVARLVALYSSQPSRGTAFLRRDPRQHRSDEEEELGGGDASPGTEPVGPSG